MARNFVRGRPEKIMLSQDLTPPSRIVPNEDRACSVIYHGQDIWIIERHCAGSNKQGIYLGNAEGVTRYEWFDEPFNTWAGNEGCNTRQDCYYEVKVDGDGRIIGFSYRFYINLSEGYYRVDVKNGEFVVLEKSIVDHPS